MTTETLITDGQNTSQADGQQTATDTAASAADTSGSSTQQQATDGQTTQGQQADAGNTDGDQGDATQQQGAPEQYEFQAPEGQQFDPAVIGAFSEVAKELNLPQDAAQKVLDKMAPVINARNVEQLEAARAQWETQSKADKEFGGAQLEENLALVKKARDTFATPELRSLLNDSGFGNHPEVVRLFYRVGKAISEDKIVVGGQGPSGGKSKAEVLYDKSAR